MYNQYTMVSNKYLKHTMLVLVMIGALFMISCAPSGNQFEKLADADGNTANFWLGIWHGFIAPVTFIISLFSNTVNVYEVYNNGNWYNFGFMLGACCSIFGGSHSSKRSSKKKNKSDCFARWSKKCNETNGERSEASSTTDDSK